MKILIVTLFFVANTAFPMVTKSQICMGLVSNIVNTSQSLLNNKGNIESLAAFKHHYIYEVLPTIHKNNSDHPKITGSFKQIQADNNSKIKKKFELARRLKGIQEFYSPEDNSDKKTIAITIKRGEIEKFFQGLNDTIQTSSNIHREIINGKEFNLAKEGSSYQFSHEKLSNIMGVIFQAPFLSQLFLDAKLLDVRMMITLIVVTGITQTGGNTYLKELLFLKYNKINKLLNKVNDTYSSNVKDSWSYTSFDMYIPKYFLDQVLNFNSNPQFVTADLDVYKRSPFLVKSVHKTTESIHSRSTKDYKKHWVGIDILYNNSGEEPELSFVLRSALKKPDTPSIVKNITKTTLKKLIPIPIKVRK